MNARPAPQLERQPTRHLRLRSWAHQLPQAPDWPSGVHPGYEIAWAESGSLRYEIGRQSFDLLPGQVMVVAPQTEHRTRPGASFSASSIWLSVELVAELADAIGRAPRIDSGPVEANERLLHVGRILIQELGAAEAGHTLLSDALSEALAIQLLRQTSSNAPRSGADPRIGRALELIEAELDSNLSVERLADAAAMSRFHFSRCFKDALGMSPYQYVTHARVERAAQLLRSGRQSVTEAALSVGFFDLGRFGRAFKRQLGCLPSELLARTRSARSADRIARSA